MLGNVLGHSARLLWHKETSLGNTDAVIIPGGFSYGDYLRTGAIARFSPIMQAVQTFAANGGLVLGVCNGFQILCEAGMLPGALIRNRSLQFRCEHVFLKTQTRNSPFTNAIPDKLMRIPIAHCLALSKAVARRIAVSTDQLDDHPGYSAEAFP